MSKPTNEQRLAAIHREALLEFDQIQAAVRDERKQCLEDRRFYSISGAQWEGPLGEQFANRPRFEVNKCHLSVIRIINEYRNNRITVDFESVDDDMAADALADTCGGLYRADEERSEANEAYDNAFEEATAASALSWRLRAEYEDDEDPENERQQICIEPIYDADTSVFFDLGAKRQDKADAKRCYVLTSMTPTAYRDEYDDDPITWPKEIQATEFDWSTPDVVFVCEYYRLEETQQTIHVWEHLDGREVRLTTDELGEQIARLTAVGAREIRTKRVKQRRAHKYLLSGGRVLEDCGYIAGQNIPVIPTYGKRWYVDGVERYMGHIRLAKDAQRLKNMQLSKLGELSALSSVEKPIFLSEQISGHTLMWAEDNIKNYPYLLINPITDASGNELPANPLAYTKVPTIPPAMAALLQITEEDMKDLLGNQQQGEEIVGNVSTETAHLVQNRLDMQTFIYMSNMAKAMKRCGEVWLGMAKDLLVEKDRVLRTVGSDGGSSRVRLTRLVITKTGEVEYENDLHQARMAVVVNVGPSSSTKRAATVRALSTMARTTDDPETKQVLGAMAMLNMDGEGISEVRAYFRQKLVKMGVVQPNERERKELAEEQANTPPSPQDEYLRSAAQAEAARGTKAQADTILAQAKADKTRAEAADIATDISSKKQEQALSFIERLGPRIAPTGGITP